MPLDVGRVDDVDDRVGARVEDELAAHDLLARVGAERVDAGQVGDGGLGMVADLTVLAVDGDAREVAHMLVRPGQAIEEGRLSAVLVAREGKRDGAALGDGLGRAARVVALAERRVRGLGGARGVARDRIGIVDARELDAARVRAPQRELIASQPDLHGVAHGGELHHGDLGTGRKPHIQNVLAQRRVVRFNRRDDRVLTDLKLIESHADFPFRKSTIPR